MSVKLLLYCTKGKPYLVYDYYDNSCGKCITADKIESYHLNGKIVAECECEKVNEFDLYGNHLGYAINLMPILKQSCLNKEDMKNYLGDKKGYALHLSNVKVFDEPKELSDYMKKNQSYRLHKYERLYNAPQNMMTIYDNEENEYILISIRPEHLCKILNGEKTIEVRKKILNSLKEVLE